MADLVGALASRLPGGSVNLKQRVSAIERADGAWRIATAEGLRLQADAVIVACEAHAAARMLRYVDPQLTELLGGIRYASAATVSLGYRRADVPHPLDGFGFVVPRGQGLSALACTFSSVKYPGRAPDDAVLLRCFFGGALDERVLGDDDTTLATRARDELRTTLGIDAAPLLTRVWRHPASMPQYLVGHLARVETIEHRVSTLPGFALAGAAYRGVGIADCVHSGEIGAERLLT
jgi:oxygen-dependent protoporphyrinogen oxidase